MAPFEYLAYYWDKRDQLFTTPNVHVPLDDSTSYFNVKEQKSLFYAGHCDENNMKEWTAVYYAMMEQIDTLIGIMLDRLDRLGLTNKTLVIFTSDYGEMLGAYCQTGKNMFFEEAARVPLIMTLPGLIVQETIVKEPVSLLDVLSTILYYIGARASDKSDGLSFRTFIEGTRYNNLFDEAAVISEWDYRAPITNTTLTRELDNQPNFMVRHGSFKLLMSKRAVSRKPDVLYNLADDPFETNNSINPKGPVTDEAMLGKAEHMRYLLIDWMERMQLSDNNKFYSDPIYNVGEGKGDIYEIQNRQSWLATNIWISDTNLVFRKAGLVGSKFVRNEWLFIGCTSPGIYSVFSFKIKGNSAALLRLNADSADVPSKEAFRLRVTLEYVIMPQASGPLDAWIEIKHSAGATINVPILVEQAVLRTGTSLPTPQPTRSPGTRPPPVSSEPSPRPTTLGTRQSLWFSGETTVMVKNSGTVLMKDLLLGDDVLGESGNYETLYGFGHRHESVEAEFLQFLPSNLEISKDHMLKIKGRYVPASSVVVGD